MHSVKANKPTENKTIDPSDLPRIIRRISILDTYKIQEEISCFPIQLEFSINSVMVIFTKTKYRGGFSEMVSKTQLLAIKQGLGLTVGFIKKDKTLLNREKGCCITGVLYGAKLAFEEGDFPEEMSEVVSNIEKLAAELFES